MPTDPLQLILIAVGLLAASRVILGAGGRRNYQPHPKSVRNALNATDWHNRKAARLLGVRTEYVKSIREKWILPDGSVKDAPSPPPAPPPPPTNYRCSRASR